MQRQEVESIFNKKKDIILTHAGVRPSSQPVAILLGGQPAAGKSSLAEAAKKNHSNRKFLVINGDNYREYHPEHNNIINNNIQNYSKETQIFSNVFTEGLIKEALDKKYDIIIEGTMRNPETPLKTAEQLKNAGFRVEAYAIAAPSVFTEISIFNRYQEEVEKKGAGRLSDMSAHNEAVKGLPESLDALYKNNAVDQISIYTFQSRKKVKDITNTGGGWNSALKPSFYIEKSVNEQLKDKPFLLDVKQRGVDTLEKLSPELKGSLKPSIEKIDNILGRRNNLSL
jgi:adenylate kinase family enzyme